MARYWKGQPVRLSSTVRQLNTDGTTTLVNATTAVYVVKIANADGTATVTGTYSSPSNDGTGLYHQDIPVTDLAATGHYQWTLTTTGPGAGVQPGDFDVADPFETAVISRQDAKDMLNIPQASTAADAEIDSFTATIETSLEAMTGGPLVNRVITGERCEFAGWYQVLQVRQRPLVQVNSITTVASGTVLDISAGLDIDPAARTIRRKDRTPFPADSRAVLVAYVAGWGNAVAPAFNTAARIILAHLWSTQHGPSARPSMGGDDLTAVPGFPFLVPRGAAELLNGSLNGMTFKDQVVAW
jgi:hypothetical protein